MTAPDAPAIFLGKGERPQYLLTKVANRHGLIAGATGTGKTVSLQILAEGFSRLGVPVFAPDVKGDLSGLCEQGEARASFEKRAAELGYDDYRFEAFPVVFWDLFGEQGHPVRATVADMGPLLLSRILDLNEVQEGVLNVAFAVAEDEDLPLLDFEDLRAMLANIGERAKALRTRYGNISTQSVGAIQRRLLTLDRQEGDRFFGEPALELEDLMRVDREGRGFINILAADRLIQQSPVLYSVFLFWLLSRLFDRLPEVGNPEKPKLVFFFDEAHLLFDRAPRALLDKIEQVVRLIRSKGVGVFFVTQNPMDVPEDVLGQLGNRIQHALRAYTPKEQKAVRIAAQTFRPNPAFDAAEAITQLEVGEALVSTLDTKGAPSMVERTRIIPPSSKLGPAAPDVRQRAMDDSPVLGKYDEPLDRDSARERLAARRKREMEEGRLQERGGAKRGRRRQTYLEATVKSVLRSLGSSLGRRIARSIVKSLFRR